MTALYNREEQKNITTLSLEEDEQQQQITTRSTRTRRAHRILVLSVDIFVGIHMSVKELGVISEI